MSSKRKNKIVESVWSNIHASALCSHLRRVVQERVREMSGNSHVTANFNQAVMLHDPTPDLRLKYDEDKKNLSCVVTTGYVFEKWLPMNLSFKMEKVRGEDRYHRYYHDSRTSDSEQYLILDSLWKMVERGAWGVRYDEDKKDSLYAIQGEGGIESSPLYITSRRYASLCSSKKSMREYKKHFKHRNACMYDDSLEWEHDDEFDAMVIHKLQNSVAMLYESDDDYNRTVKSALLDQKDNQTNHRYDGGFGDTVSGTHDFVHNSLICEILHLKNLLSGSSYKKGIYKIGGNQNA